MDNQPNTTLTPQAATAMVEGMTKPSWGKLALGSFSTPDQMAFIHKVYGWMSLGLIISAVVAY